MKADGWQSVDVNTLTAELSGVESASGHTAPIENILDSLAYYHCVFDNVNDAIFFHDLTGQFLQVNQAACQQLGYSRDELLTMTVQQLHSPEAAVRFDGSMERLLREGNLLIERSHRRKDGSFMPV